MPVGNKTHSFGMPPKRRSTALIVDVDYATSGGHEQYRLKISIGDSASIDCMQRYLQLRLPSSTFSRKTTALRIDCGADRLQSWQVTPRCSSSLNLRHQSLNDHIWRHKIFSPPSPWTAYTLLSHLRRCSQRPCRRAPTSESGRRARADLPFAAPFAWQACWKQTTERWTD